MPIKFHEGSKTFHIYNKHLSYITCIMENQQKPAHRNPGELLQRQQPGKQTAPYVESTCEQPVYKLAELLCLPVNSVRPVWNTGF